MLGVERPGGRHAPGVGYTDAEQSPGSTVVAAGERNHAITAQPGGVLTGWPDVDAMGAVAAGAAPLPILPLVPGGPGPPFPPLTPVEPAPALQPATPIARTLRSAIRRRRFPGRHAALPTPCSA